MPTISTPPCSSPSESELERILLTPIRRNPITPEEVIQSLRAWPTEDRPLSEVPTIFSDGTIMWTDEWIDLRARGRDEIDLLLARGQTSSCSALPEKYVHQEPSPAPDSPEATESAGGTPNTTTSVNSYSSLSPTMNPDLE